MASGVGFFPPAAVDVKEGAPEKRLSPEGAWNYSPDVLEDGRGARAWLQRGGRRKRVCGGLKIPISCNLR